MAKKEENTAVPQISKEVIEQSKATHGDKLRVLELPKDDDYEEILEALAVIPSRSVTSQYLRFSKENPKKAQEILVKQCVLTSKEDILADDGLFYAAAMALVELIPIREGKSRRL